MLVKDRMTTNPHTIPPTTPVSEALSFMRQQNVRRLPVINKKGRMVGIVSEKDLLYASPSPATSLSVYEVGYLLSKLKVAEIMTQDVTTVAPDAPLEEAARIMADGGVGGLPVMEGERLVGIITETDIFKAIIEMLGAREKGLRLTLQVHDEPGVLSRVTEAIAALGGDIIALGTFYAEPACDAGMLMLKVHSVEKDAVIEALENVEAHVVDVREL